MLGFGDYHDPKFNRWHRTGVINDFLLEDGTISGIELSKKGCKYTIDVYPTQTFYDTETTSTPLIITCSIIAVFIFATLMFLVYDRLVERRQKIVLAKATQSTAIVASLFPKSVTERLMEGEAHAMATKTRLKGFLDGDEKQNESNLAPIADLFPKCTVFFADIAGFTAWSSTREPSQVFILLQSVYQAFDVLAKRRKVFKVKTS